MYELWNLEGLSLPQRSRLYNLEPFGIGTPNTESLTSYLLRLSEAHHVPLYTLVVREIFPLLDKGTDHQRLSQGSSKDTYVRIEHSLNGVAPTSIDWIHALETLTLRNDLQYLTLSTWSSILSTNPMRSNKAWCPLCYNEQRQSGEMIHDLLLWSIAMITVCPVHHQPLDTRCPNNSCRKTLTHLTHLARPGYCSYCKEWLGVVLNVENAQMNVLSDEELEWQKWVGDAMGELVTSAPRLGDLPQSWTVAEAITEYSKLIGEENSSKLARKLHVESRLFRQWQQGQNVPTLDNLLRLCYRVAGSPLTFLSSTLDVPVVEEHFHANDSTVEVKRHLSSFKKEDMRKALEELLMRNEVPAPSLGEVARRTGYPRKSLLRHVPDLCYVVTIRYQQPKNSDEIRAVLETEHSRDVSSCSSLNELARSLGCSAKYLEKYYSEYCREIAKRRCQQFNDDDVRKLMEAMLTSTEFTLPSLQQVARESGYTLKTLRRRFPELCRAIVEHRCKHLDIDRLRKALETIVEGDGPFRPSLEEVAQRLRCTPPYLKKHFPKLCRTISERHLKFTDVHEARDTLEAIAQSNELPPPSLTEVSRRLGYEIKTLRHYWPELCRVIVERHKYWSDIDSIRQHLETVLASSCTFPPLFEVALRVGRSTDYLRKHLPELSHAISLRHREYKKRANEARVQQYCDEVCHAVREVDAQGVYPSLFRVSLLLKQRACLRIPVVHNAWLETVRELHWKE